MGDISAPSLYTRLQSCKNVPTVPTSWCYFFWPVLIFGKNTRKQAKTRENRRKTGAFLVLIFWGGKLVGANFYAFCSYAIDIPPTPPPHPRPPPFLSQPQIAVCPDFCATVQVC